MMKRLTISNLTLDDIKQIAKVTYHGIADWEWTQCDTIILTKNEQVQIDALRERLTHGKPTLMNEATIWARAIYPLLALAEQGNIQAWAQVALQAQYPHVELHGIVDGILGNGISDVVETPYVLVVEAKRGLEAQDPRYQLYGYILAAGYLNWEHDQQPNQHLFGCYTIADIWTFIHAIVQDIDSDLPHLIIESSREYVERMEMETILRLLKHMVATQATKQC
jgi:hypothetical protein